MIASSIETPHPAEQSPPRRDAEELADSIMRAPRRRGMSRQAARSLRELAVEILRRYLPAMGDPVQATSARESSRAARRAALREVIERGVTACAESLVLDVVAFGVVMLEVTTVRNGAGALLRLETVIARAQNVARRELASLLLRAPHVEEVRELQEIACRVVLGPRRMLDSPAWPECVATPVDPEFAAWQDRREACALDPAYDAWCETAIRGEEEDPPAPSAEARSTPSPEAPRQVRYDEADRFVRLDGVEVPFQDGRKPGRRVSVDSELGRVLSDLWHGRPARMSSEPTFSRLKNGVMRATGNRVTLKRDGSSGAITVVWRADSGFVELVT